MMLKGRFEIEKEIGRGGVGIVFRAVDTADRRRPVVIKVLLEHPDENVRKWISQHFHKEAQALARINHPGVVQFIDSGATEEGKPFLAMEFIDGCDLRSQIDPNRGLIGDFERAAHIIRQLGAAISAAHDQGVYHRDLKPENIRLQKPRSYDEDEQVKVIDFGIATVKDTFDEKTKTTQLFVGSKLYTAPEQIENKPSAASDIYAIGVIAYEMLTGRTPFVPDLKDPIAGMVQLLQMQREGVRVKPKDLRPSLPEKAQEIILKTLAYKAGDRYARAEDFGRELAEALLNANEPSAPQLLDRTREAEAASAKAASEAKIKSSMRRRLIFALTFLIAATAIGAAVWSKIYSESASNTTALIKPIEKEHTLIYWGELQKYRGDAPIGKPTRLTGGAAGEAYFRAGDGLRLYITSSDDGYLYLINEEGSTSNASPKYTILFPSFEANGGLAKVIAERETATSEFVFDLKSEGEKVWMIWSVDSIAELDKAVQQWINPKDGGEIKDPGQVEFLSNFIKRRADKKPQAQSDDANETMLLRGKGDALVYLLKLKYR